MGRHIVANRDIEVGEVLFHESPIVTYYMAFDPETLGTFIYYVSTFLGFFDLQHKYGTFLHSLMSGLPQLAC